MTGRTERMRDQAAKAAQRTVADIGKPCSHFSGCSRTSTAAVGWWYPSVGSGVFCDGHADAIKGRGDTLLRARAS